MQQVWENCLTFNPPTDEFHRLGEGVRRRYEQFWTEEGFPDGARAKRATAGLAAPKFDPEELDALQTMRSKSESRGGGGGGGGGGSRRPPAGRSEATSRGGARAGGGGGGGGAGAGAGPLPKLEDLAAALGELDPELQAQAVEFINEEAKVPDGEGGIELDLTKMTAGAMRALDRYIKSGARRARALRMRGGAGWGGAGGASRPALCCLARARHRSPPPPRNKPQPQTRSHRRRPRPGGGLREAGPEQRRRRLLRQRRLGLKGGGRGSLVLRVFFGGPAAGGRRPAAAALACRAAPGWGGRARGARACARARV